MAALLPGKFLYLATPHTASLATVRALTEQLPGCSEVLSASGRHRYGHHHATRDEFELPGRELVWSVRREPRDVLVTCWLRYGGLSGHEETLEDFVRSWGGPPFVVDGRFAWQDVDEWVEYEDIDAGINRLLARLGLPPVSVPRYNETPGKGPWRERWTRAAQEAFEGRFGRSELRGGQPSAPTPGPVGV